MNRQPLILALAAGQLLVAVILWKREPGIAMVFVAIAAGLLFATPRTPRKIKRKRF